MIQKLQLAVVAAWAVMRALNIAIVCTPFNWRIDAGIDQKAIWLYAGPIGAGIEW